MDRSRPVTVLRWSGVWCFCGRCCDRGVWSAVDGPWGWGGVCATKRGGYLGVVCHAQKVSDLRMTNGEDWMIWLYSWLSEVDPFSFLSKQYLCRIIQTHFNLAGVRGRNLCRLAASHCSSTHSHYYGNVELSWMLCIGISILFIHRINYLPMIPAMRINIKLISWWEILFAQFYVWMCTT